MVLRGIKGKKIMHVHSINTATATISSKDTIWNFPLIAPIKTQASIKKVTAIATGGYCSTVAQYMTRPFDAINENLVLDGLYELWKLNR